MTIDSSFVDNGSSGCSAIFSLDDSSFDCGDIGANTVELTVTDRYGNTATCTSTVIVEDLIAPEPLCQDITIQLDASGNASTTAAEVNNGSNDACGILSMTLDKTDFDCTEVGPNTVTLTVTDNNSNTATCDAIVTVENNVPPVLVCNPIEIVLYDNGKYVLSPKDIAAISAGSTSNCTSYDDLDISVFPRSFECIHIGAPVPVEATAIDLYGNVSSCWTTVTVYDETPPVAICKDIILYLDENGKASIFPGDLILGDVFDVCDVDSTWASQNLFNCGDIGNNTVTLSVKDASDNVGSCTSIVTVRDTFPPKIQNIEDVTIEVAPGICSTKIDYPYAVVSGTCGFTFEQTVGLGPDGEFPLGTTTETWIATNDGGNNAEVTFTVTITTTNGPPTIVANFDVFMDEDNSPSVTVPISGISYGVDCVAQDVTVSAVSTNPALVTGVTVNYTAGATTGTVDVDIKPEMSGDAVITVTVEDSEGATTSETFTITVVPVNDPPFLVTPVADHMVNASYVLKVPISQVLGEMFDDIDDASLTVDVMVEGGGALPAWATMTGDTLVCAPLIADTGCVNVVVTATDAAGATVTDMFELCVEGYPVSIGDLGAGLFEVQMYPNPARGTVNLDINSSGIYDVNLSVLDIAGKVVIRKQYSASEQITFDMSGKVSGMYFVHLKVDGKQIVKKLVVDRK